MSDTANSTRMTKALNEDTALAIGAIGSDLLAITGGIVSAYLSKNDANVNDIPALIAITYTALTGVGAAPEPEKPKQEPAVSIRSSVKPDYIVCLEDGKKLKMLKRYLATQYGMTPEDYRAKWNLPSDYPMVAPNYSEQRRTLAKTIGLGRKPAGSPPPKAARARKPKAAA